MDSSRATDGPESANPLAADSFTPVLTVDARGHRCPVPTLRLRRALTNVSPGAVVELLADDPMARVDVPHYAAQAGHALLQQTDLADGGVRFVLRRS